MVCAVGLAAACGGPQIPQHAGYKTDKVKPWAKPKALKFDAKTGEAKTEGDLSYAAYKRAKWFAVDLPAHGDLDLKLEVTPPGDAVNEEFDLAIEVLDPANRVISKSDLEDEEAGELNKKRTLKDLDPGRYLIHVYLQGRMDSADFMLVASFKPTSASEGLSDFPSQVLFPPPLAVVPLDDDTPKTYKPVVATTKSTSTITIKKGPKPPKPADKPVVATVTARVLGVAVVGGGTQITVGRGTDSGASVGMKVSMKGVAGGATLSACNARTCTAQISATPDQIKSAGGEVTLSP